MFDSDQIHSDVVLTIHNNALLLFRLTGLVFSPGNRAGFGRTGLGIFPFVGVCVRNGTRYPRTYFRIYSSLFSVYGISFLSIICFFSGSNRTVCFPTTTYACWKLWISRGEKQLIFHGFSSINQSINQSIDRPHKCSCSSLFFAFFPDFWCRLRGQKAISKVLSGVTEFKDWIREGSICCPRLVFVFSGLPRGIANADVGSRIILSHMWKFFSIAIISLEFIKKILRFFCRTLPRKKSNRTLRCDCTQCWKNADSFLSHGA